MPGNGRVVGLSGVCVYGYGMLMSSKKSETIISPP